MEGKKINVNDILMENRKKIVDDIIKSIEENQAMFSYDWNRELLRPQNPVSGAKYNGINRLILGREAVSRNLDDPRWLTYSQAKEKGWTVKKGAKGVKCEKWIFTELKEEKIINAEGKEEIIKKEVERSRPIASYFVVFNAKDIHGIPPYEKNIKTTEQTFEIANNFINSSECPIIEVLQDRAYYSLNEDKIILPPKEYFKDELSFLSTTLHEMGHSTGHPSRLNRQFGKFGNQAYAREELTAELTSMFIQSDLGIELKGEHLNNHAGYLKSWVSVLKNDYQEFYRAINESQKASDLLYNNYLEYLKENNIELNKETEKKENLFDKLEVIYHYSEKEFNIPEETTLKGIEAYKFLNEVVKFDKELTEKRENISEEDKYISYSKLYMTFKYGDYNTNKIRIDLGDGEFGKREQVSEALKYRLDSFPDSLLTMTDSYVKDYKKLGKNYTKEEIIESANSLKEEISNCIKDFQINEKKYLNEYPDLNKNLDNSKDIDKLSIKLSYSEFGGIFLENTEYNGKEAVKLLNELFQKEQTLKETEGYYKTRINISYDNEIIFSDRMDLGDRIAENPSQTEKKDINHFFNYYLYPYLSFEKEEKSSEFQKMLKTYSENINNLYTDEKEGFYKEQINENSYNVGYYENGTLKTPLYVYTQKEDSTYYISEYINIPNDGLGYHNFFNEDNQLTSSKTFYNNKFTGLVEEYNKNCEIISCKFEPENFNPQNLTDENGLKQGLWIEKDDTYFKIYNYKDNNLEGKYNIFYSNGLLAETGEYLNGTKLGTVNKYYETGEKLSSEDYSYSNDGSEIIFKNQYTQDGNYLTKEKYLDGILEGDRTIIFLGHKGYTPIIEEHYSNNELTGLRKEYYENGRIKSELNFTNSKAEGQYKEYYENGIIKKEGQYLDGKREGNWIWNYESGEKLREIEYLNGNVPFNCLMYNKNEEVVV
ncbi:zincin-like metallopeptidase domain-containing protein [Fusobacterium sp. SYSU M8D902]|uniref:zincin-like metallopeptidase domain-containing protein n=1 Tax=Fusobacterium sp. SYSU M8D902 TaxID=3159562 RepID=UPI0032E3FA46